MICRKCNHEYPDDMETCPICGEPRPDTVSNEPADSGAPSVGNTGTTNAYGAGRAAMHSEAQQWRAAPAAQPPYPAVRPAEDAKSGTAPLVLGILSLMIPYVGIVLGILALVFGNGAKKTNPIGSANYALGQAGWVLGLIGLVFQVILIVYLSFAFSMFFKLIDDISSYGGYGYNGFGGYNPFF